MKKDLEEKLVKEFPFLYSKYGGSPKETTMAWGFSHDDGWFDIVHRLSKAITEADVRALGHPKCVAEQVKEKFGGLRFYVGAASMEVHKLIEAAEMESYKTCEVCGSPGELDRSRSWHRTLCPKCNKEVKR